MKLTEIRVRNFRSIETEQKLPIPSSMTLVGPNNSGKTNLLKAIQLLFTGLLNSYGYTREDDLTFGAGKNRTSITALFDGNPEDDPLIYADLDELHTLQGTRRQNNQIYLTLYFTETNTPVYSFFPNLKRPQNKTQAVQYSRTHINLLNRILSRFRLHYVPSAKSIDEIYHELITPFLRRKVANVVDPQILAIENTLSEAAEALNSELTSANLSGFRANFRIPKNSIEQLISGFEFTIADPDETPIQDKGMGIQTTALLAAFRWITTQERSAGYEVIWLLEEPESYLHPHLAKHCSTILDNLAKEATVVKTTHSMAFVPQDPRQMCGTQLSARKRTEVVEHKTFSEAVQAIRSALGIRFGDFYNLHELNVFVEGPGDRETFTSVLAYLPEKLYPLAHVRRAKFEDFGGIRHLAGFLRATYQFIRKERPCVAVFDGDPEGEKERKALQHYFGQNQIPFETNLHFVSVRARFALEGLFPDSWIKDVYSAHPNWFETYAVDASGDLEPFDVKDERKPAVLQQLMNRAELDILANQWSWAQRFISVLTAIDSALEAQASLL